MPRLKTPKDFDWSEQNKEQTSFKETQIFHFLNNLHQTLKQRFSWYNLYHSLSNVSFLNLGILILSFVLFFAYTFPYISIPLSLQKGKVLGTSWYDYSWQYRDTITINNTNNGDTLTDYQVLLEDSGPEVGYWKFDEGSGTTASDSSGNGNDGTLYPAASGGTGPTWTTGKYNNALGFDGSEDYVYLDTNPSLADATDFSLVAWVKTNSATNQVIIEQRGLGDSGYLGQYELKVLNNGLVYFAIYNYSYQWEITSNTSVNDGNWHLIVAIRSRYAGYIYIDGTEDKSAVSSSIKGLNSSLPTVIGADYRDGDEYFNGLIDEVRVYDRALYPREVSRLYANNTHRSGDFSQVYQYETELFLILNQAESPLKSKKRLPLSSLITADPLSGLFITHPPCPSILDPTS